MTDHDRPLGPDGDPIAETIARVRELDAAATKGPWRSCDHAGWAHPFVSVVCERDRDVIAPDGRYPNDPEVIGRTCMTRGKIQDELANAALIAYYRTACPQLADACEALRAECERLRGELEMIRDAAADAIRDNEHVGFTVRTLHALRSIKLKGTR